MFGIARPRMGPELPRSLGFGGVEAGLGGALFEESLVLTGSPADTNWRSEARGGAAPAKPTEDSLLLPLRAAGLLSSANRPASFACQFLRPFALMVPCQDDVVSLDEVERATFERVGEPVRQAGASRPGANGRREHGARVPTVTPSTLADQPPHLGTLMSCRFTVGGRPAGRAHRCRWTWTWPPPEATPHGNASEKESLRRPLPRSGPIPDALGQRCSRRREPSRYFWVPRRKELPWLFANLDLLVHFHVAEARTGVYMDSEVITGSGGLSSAQTQVWSDSAELLATSISQIHFFPITG